MQPTERFTSRVSDYVKYRPGYPIELVEELERAGLQPGGVVADIASGTGISTEPFLRRGYAVIGIEPNDAMREAALRAGHDSRKGRAESTGLHTASVDLVFCAQAFHWLDHEMAAREFVRIVRPGGLIGIAWNLRQRSSSPFAEQLEALLCAFSEEYTLRVLKDQERAERAVERAFAPRAVNTWQHTHAQHFDWDGFLGRIHSASYAPKENPEFNAALKELFERHNSNGEVTILYDCRLYWLRA